MSTKREIRKARKAKRAPEAPWRAYLKNLGKAPDPRRTVSGRGNAGDVSRR
jgi:hypothetical protein